MPEGAREMSAVFNSTTGPPDPPAPIYDLCDFCRLPIRPGEEHGVLEVAQTPDQTPGVICRVRTLAMTTTVIPSQKGQR